MKRKIFLFLLFVSAGLLQCKGQQENSYKVDFCFPEGQVNERVIKFISEYALEETADGQLKKYSDIATVLGVSLVRKLYNGMPIYGTLKFSNDFLGFEPVFGSQFLVKNCKIIQIPFSDITSVVRQTKYLVYEYVKINTINGSFEFLVKPEYLGSDQGKNICKDILSKIKRQSTSTIIPGSYPQASERLLSDNDLHGKSAYDLKIMRNEVYARHGYIFKTPQMKTYFSEQSWYRGIYDNIDGQLSAIERSNMELIKAFENR